MHPSFLTGFIKQASVHGISEQESFELCKRAFPEELQHLIHQLQQNPELSHGLMGGAAGAGIGALAEGKDHRMSGAAIGGAMGGAGGAYEGGHQEQMHNWLNVLHEKGEKGAKGVKEKAEHFMHGNEKGVHAISGANGLDGVKDFGDKSQQSMQDFNKPLPLSDKEFTPVTPERDIPMTNSDWRSQLKHLLGGGETNHHVSQHGGGLDMSRGNSFNIGDTNSLPQPSPKTLLDILAGKHQLD